MALLEWNESMRVNVADIDQQHRELVRMICALNDSMAAGASHQVMGDTISGLIDYTRTHFATEETYFERYDYPGAAAHKAQHSEFVAQVEDFKRGFDEGRLFLSLDVMDFLGQWLLGHIQGSDKVFGPFLNERGVN
jgi:hemerythrin